MFILLSLFSFANEPAKTYTVKNIDVCRCLTEKGNSPFIKANSKTCDVAMSKKLEVADWTRTDFSTNAPAKAKWKELEKECNDTTAQCMTTEKAKRGCTAETIKDPNWEPQGCTKALIDALNTCSK